MKKVAILLTSEPEMGGEHQYLVLMMESLTKFNGKYFDILAICCNRFWRTWCRRNKVESINYAISQNADKIAERNAQFSCFFLVYNTFFDPLSKMLLKNKVNLFICGQQGIFLPKLPCKVMRPVHDLMHRYEPDFPEIKSTIAQREILFSGVSKLADVILVDSKLGKKQFKESYPKGKRNQRIRILPFTVPSHINNQREEMINTPEKYVFYPAQFWMHKNHVNLVKSINLVKEKAPDIRLLLVGSEKNSLSKVKKTIRENKLEDNVLILGFVSDEQITYLYRHAVAMIMPSYFGPTNIPPLEAMTLGCPAIVSNKYAMGEQVGNAGLLFDPDSPQEIANCILQVWKDEEMRQYMIQKGYEQVKQWTVMDFKNKFLKIVLSEL